jgi:hypothetical protein
MVRIEAILKLAELSNKQKLSTAAAVIIVRVSLVGKEHANINSGLLFEQLRPLNIVISESKRLNEK